MLLDERQPAVGETVPALKYLGGYPATLLAPVEALIAQGRLGQVVAERYPHGHEVRSDRALVDYVAALKREFMRSAPPLAKVAYDPRLEVLHQALGMHSAVSRVQGNQLKAKCEIRVASLFKLAPAPFLKMIVVHELAHLRQRAHDKAFYALCRHMEPAYHQLEFDTRLWLTAREIELAAVPGPGTADGAPDPGQPGRR